VQCCLSDAESKAVAGVTNHWTTNHWTGLDWTGILKFVFTLRGMQLKGNHIRV